MSSAQPENQPSEDVERSYVQLVRKSSAVQHDLSSKKQLQDGNYNEYLNRMQQLMTEWQTSCDVGDRKVEKIPLDPSAEERMKKLKEKFMRNMKTVQVRLNYLDPARLYRERAKMYEKKLEFYVKEKAKNEKGEQTKASHSAIEREIHNTLSLIQVMITEIESACSNEVSLRDHLSALLAQFGDSL